MLTMTEFYYSIRFLVCLACVFLSDSITTAELHKYTFVIEETSVTRLCQTHKIITVNGQLPGPTLYVNNGDTLIINVYNKANYNATMHWHGVRQIRSAWADGPAYITQCPIQPGGNFTYKFKIIGQEGTLWWHAHISWLRATVHGALVIYPQQGHFYPFPQPHAEVPIVLGEWWNMDPIKVEYEANLTGAAPNISDAFTINGQPGDLYPCSTSGTFQLCVQHGKTYLLRMVNAAVNSHLFFKIAGHSLTVVAVDAIYTKPYTTEVMFIAPGQSTDVLLTANQWAGKYYMAAKKYTTQPEGYFDNTTTTAILSYDGFQFYTNPILPNLPQHNDTATVTTFTRALRSLVSPAYPVDVPKDVNERLFITVGLGLLPCPTGATCGGPNNTRITASMNNVSFVLPDISILESYYFNINDVFTTDFPSNPPLVFNYTGDVSKSFWAPVSATKVKVLNYNDAVEVVLQGTNIFQADNHPMHVHGYHFYVVGEGFGNYNAQTDPLTFNLIDPPQRNTVGVPVNGWVAIRFKADNPGVWYVHCHFDDHVTWGLNMVFVVKNGATRLETLDPPPPDLLKC